MRLRLTGQENPEERPRFCPNCGAPNTTFGLRCTVCGQLYSDKPPIASYWDRRDQPASADDEQAFEDMYTEPPEPARPEEHDAATPTAPYRPMVDPWSSAGGRLGAEPGSVEAFTPPSSVPVDPEGGGPPGWFLGLLGLLLIALVAGAVLVIVFRPLVSDQVESATSDAIASALAQATVVPDATAGTVVISEQEVNRSIRAHRSDYEPVDDLRIQIRRTGLEATFTVYGVEGTLTGGAKVVGNRLVITNPSLDGVAGPIVDVDEIVGNAEDAINDLLARNNLRATAVTLSDDTLTITTEPVAGTQ